MTRVTVSSCDSTQMGIGVSSTCSAGGVCEMRSRALFAPAARAIEADRTSVATSAKARAAQRCKVPALPSTFFRYKPMWSRIATRSPQLEHDAHYRRDDASALRAEVIDPRLAGHYHHASPHHH